MSNLQIARDILERACDAGDVHMIYCARECLKAFKWKTKPPEPEWSLVKAFWLSLNEPEGAP